jgi:2-(1,2-epoxy-1,2-dihydrophenyl)acetyl-CoA isomerase
MNATDTTAPPELATMRIEIDGPVGTLTLARPKALNAMSPELIGELSVAASWLADSAPIRALVITGEGRAFSAGGDVNWFKEGLERDDIDLPASVRRGADVLHQAIVDLRRIEYPVIGAINGAAAGAGFSLALQCDIRIASEAASFHIAYGRIGAAPDGGMTYFLPRVIGPGPALELLLMDPDLSAADALERGLVAKVVPADALLDEARSLAAELSAKAPHYVRMCKRLAASSLDNSLADHLQLERHGIADSMATADLARAVPAFFAGEKPSFTGE